MGWARARFGVTQEATDRVNATGDNASLQQTDPPEHTRLRSLVNKAFTPRRAEGLRARIGELAAPMVDALAAGAPDVMASIAFPLPVTVIGELVGVPAEEHETVRAGWITTMAAAAAGAGPEVLAAGAQAQADLNGYFSELIARRRTHPADDLLSGLIDARDTGGRLSESELLSTVRLLFLAGFVTTTYLIGNGLHALLRHPDQQARLWADHALLSSAVEEMLRYDSPVQLARRLTLDTAEHGGIVLEKGSDIVVLTGAANRDPDRFVDPDTFDITRTDNVPLSFGWGIHHCIGAPLARLEAQIVFGLMIDRFARLELADPAQPGPSTSWFVRGLNTLPVHATPR